MPMAAMTPRMLLLGLARSSFSLVQPPKRQSTPYIDLLTANYVTGCPIIGAAACNSSTLAGTFTHVEANALLSLPDFDCR